MEVRHKILLVDDDPDLLDIYRETLAQMPSQPEIHTASSGAKAMAMLEATQYRLLISDLRMPKMDGMQVLSIVRRKYPELRTVVLTSMADEQFRSRVYALGVDLYWQKPNSEEEIKMLLDCLESLLGREAETGFRGVQSKSLVDLVQLECISQSSSALRITNGPFTGHIWINSGELIDAETEGERGEEAFQKILGWKAGNFEFLPADANRPRTIFKSYNALLLETAQALDESRGDTELLAASAGPAPRGPVSRLTPLTQLEGVEFVLTTRPVVNGDKPPVDSRGLENPERLAVWAHATLERFRALGDALHVGGLEQINGLGLQRHVALAPKDETILCVGWQHTLTADEVRERMKKILNLWAS